MQSFRFLNLAQTSQSVRLAQRSVSGENSDGANAKSGNRTRTREDLETAAAFGRDTLRLCE